MPRSALAHSRVRDHAGAPGLVGRPATEAQHRDRRECEFRPKTQTAIIEGAVLHDLAELGGPERLVAFAHRRGHRGLIGEVQYNEQPRGVCEGRVRF